MRRVVTAMLLATGLGGCMVGPDYQRPEVPLVDHWHSDTDYQSGEGEVISDNNWAEIFNDPQLIAAISTALANNRIC